MKIIEMINYSKDIRNVRVLSNISYTFKEGNVYKIEGTNGSGKTMCLRALAGLIYPTEGSIKVNNIQLSYKNEYPGKVGVIIETPHFWNDYTGLEMLQYLAEIRNEITINDIENSMLRVGLEPNDKRKIGKYSLGMKQKLAIAQAIMEKPDFLFLDEPLNALDKDGVSRFADIIKKEKDRGAIIVIATHNDSACEMEYDFVIKIHEGSIIID